MLSFVESKKPDWNVIQSFLNLSEDKNHWSNFGPVSLLLEKKIKDVLKIDDEHCVIVSSSGTSALHALVNLYSYIEQRELVWLVSSFGFPCTIMGPLKEAKVIDCDPTAIIDLNIASNKKFDGIILTNPFGTLDSIDEYKNYCKENNKLLIIDCAAAMFCEHVSNTVISFHHTKPWGFGEGGCVIINKEYESTFRSLLNFGLETNQPVSLYATNGKMSDISAAFILDRLEKVNIYKQEYNEQYDRIVNIASTQGFNVLGRIKPILSSNVPLISSNGINTLVNPYILLKKYYKPLLATPNATSIYKNIVNFPCHGGVASLSDDQIQKCLNTIKGIA
jgi:dTDP-4-amino-4,6-dideoxygalactose transaminase